MTSHVNFVAFLEYSLMLALLLINDYGDVDALCHNNIYNVTATLPGNFKVTSPGAVFTSAFSSSRSPTHAAKLVLFGVVISSFLEARN